MEVTVYSLLEGNASGHIKFKLPSSYTIGDLLKLYCKEKKITLCKDYILYRRGIGYLNPSKSLEDEDIISGDYLTLTQITKDEDNQSLSFGSWCIITVIALIIGVLGSAYVLYIYFTPLSQTQKFGLVIDAGSSHSKLFVFSWSKTDYKSEAEVELLHSCIMEGGLAGFRSHIVNLSSYLVPCLKKAEEIIPAAAQPKTPLILAATAGMRILQTYDPEGVDLLLASVREVFLTKTKFLTHHNDVFVASGQQEGIGGWAALNYLMEYFKAEQMLSDYPASTLDLGGASVEVTTELTSSNKQWPTVNISLFNNHYRIYSKSFLCYGIIEAFHRYKYLLVSSGAHENGNKLTTIVDPCLPDGLTVAFDKNEFLDPCVFSNEMSALYGGNLKQIIILSDKKRRKYQKYEDDINLESNTKTSEVTSLDIKYNRGTESALDIKYTLQGSSNATECQARISELFNFTTCRKNFVIGDCFNKDDVPSYKGKLVGFSSIFSKLLPLLGISHESSLEEFEASVHSTCSSKLNDIKVTHSGLSQQMLEDLCFDSMYIYTLLTHGLGITPARWKQISFINKVRKKDIVWAMGLMLKHVAKLPMERRQKRIDLFTFCLLMMMFCTFLLFSILFVWHAVLIKIKRSSYQRILSSYDDTI